MTIAVLKEDGKVPSERERLMIVVIGGGRQSIHDFRRLEHVEFEDERMALRTSSMVAGGKSERGGGGVEGGGLRF